MSIRPVSVGRGLLAAVLSMAIAGCSNSEPAATTVEPAPVEDSELALVDPPRAVTTPTGVVVPVLSANGSSYVVSTPCGRDTTLVWGQPLRDIQVVLDPGHGGSEDGAIGGSLTEATVNFEVAQLTASLLTAKGISVALTRTSDYRIPVTSRVAVIEALRPQAYVSIHHNSSPVDPSDEPGSEVYVQRSSAESARLGGLIHDRVVQVLSSFEGVTWISARNAGVLSVVNEDGEDAYGIVRGPSSPGVLAELAYLSNPSEAELIGTEEYQLAVSEAMADAIINFLTEPDAEGTELSSDEREFPVDNSTGGSQNCEDPELV